MFFGTSLDFRKKIMLKNLLYCYILLISIIIHNLEMEEIKLNHYIIQYTTHI